MKTNYTVFHPDGSELKGALDWPEFPSRELVSEFVETILPASALELMPLEIHHDHMISDMFVKADYHQPRNESATTVYRQNYIVHNPGTNPESLPFIAGPAVLFYRKVWL